MLQKNVHNLGTEVLFQWSKTLTFEYFDSISFKEKWFYMINE